VDIQTAIRRNWAINADNVHVKVSGNWVTLKATVVSIYQKEKPQRWKG
jgi:hypothetical protein